MLKRRGRVLPPRLQIHPQPFGPLVRFPMPEPPSLFVAPFPRHPDHDRPVGDRVRQHPDPRERLRAEDGEVDELLLRADAPRDGCAATVPCVQERTKRLRVAVARVEDRVRHVEQERRGDLLD